MKSLFVALFCLLSVAAWAGDFDNWYFQLASERCEVEGEIFNAAGEQIGTFVGVTHGELSEDGKSFTEHFEYTYMPGGAKSKGSATWTRGKDGAYRASGKTPDRVRYFTQMKVEKNKTYIQRSSFTDGRMAESKAQLKEDGSLSLVDTIKTKEVGLMMTLTYRRTKVAE